MTVHGFESMEIAKQNGSWYTFDNVDDGILPDDLKKAFEEDRKAHMLFETLKAAERKHILHFFAKIKTQAARDRNIKKIN